MFDNDPKCAFCGALLADDEESRGVCDPCVGNGSFGPTLEQMLKALQAGQVQATPVQIIDPIRVGSA